LRAVRGLLSQNAEEILRANQKDLAKLSSDTTSAFRDRLTLTNDRLEHIVTSLETVALLSDPVGEVVDDRTLHNGLRLRRVRAPLGVILMIFESRPNVILESFSLAFKSGNAIALRGGRDSAHTAQVFYRLMRQALKTCGVDQNSFYGLDNYDRSLVEALLKRKDWIDIVVPRGGDQLIEFVTRTALMPIIKNDRGMCHGYVDFEADLEMAATVIANAKTSRPGVCNSLETVLVHERVAGEFLPSLYELCAKLVPHGLRWKCDSRTFNILSGRTKIETAIESDWNTEHLDQILNCRVVASIEEALTHIERHGSHHSETILTMNEATARHFQREVDAAAVYWNASTRFTDGFEFGLGGELGISTQKLHVRGPVGLNELTTARWIIDGRGQIRK
jgi:glutamate-5-semialdehyde dehydrogenase